MDICRNVSNDDSMDVVKEFSGGEPDQTSIRSESAQLKSNAMKVSEVTIPWMKITYL